MADPVAVGQRSENHTQTFNNQKVVAIFEYFEQACQGAFPAAFDHERRPML